jgi:hypothetical protein
MVEKTAALIEELSAVSGTKVKLRLSVMLDVLSHLFLLIHKEQNMNTSSKP